MPGASFERDADSIAGEGVHVRLDAAGRQLKERVDHRLGTRRDEFGLQHELALRGFPDGARLHGDGGAGGLQEARGGGEHGMTLGDLCARQGWRWREGRRGGS